MALVVTPGVTRSCGIGRNTPARPRARGGIRTHTTMWSEGFKPPRAAIPPPGAAPRYESRSAAEFASRFLRSTAQSVTQTRGHATWDWVGPSPSAAGPRTSHSSVRKRVAWGGERSLTTMTPSTMSPSTAAHGRPRAGPRSRRPRVFGARTGRRPTAVVGTGTSARSAIAAGGAGEGAGGMGEQLRRRRHATSVTKGCASNIGLELSVTIASQRPIPTDRTSGRRGSRPSRGAWRRPRRRRTR